VTDVGIRLLLEEKLSPKVTDEVSKCRYNTSSTANAVPLPLKGKAWGRSPFPSRGRLLGFPFAKSTKAERAALLCAASGRESRA